MILKHVAKIIPKSVTRLNYLTVTDGFKSYNSQHHASHVYFVCQLNLLFVLLHSLISDSVLNRGVAKSSTNDQAF